MTTDNFLCLQCFEEYSSCSCEGLLWYLNLLEKRRGLDESVRRGLITIDDKEKILGIYKKKYKHIQKRTSLNV